jgi:hypothetical protein
MLTFSLPSSPRFGMSEGAHHESDFTANDLDVMENRKPDVPLTSLFLI